MSDQFDCVVCGEVCVDLPLRPIDQHQPLREMGIVPVEPIRPGSGGIVSNGGIAMARLGLTVGAFGYVGNDLWGETLTRLFADASLNTQHLLRHPDLPTSVSVVLVGEDGEHTFVYHSGASRAFDPATVLARLDLFRGSTFALFGYYALMPELEHDLPGVLREVQRSGCRTALDSAGGGGKMQPLDRILPHLDIYVPSYDEAQSQTGEADPQRMITVFRECCPGGLLGVKLGNEGALLSPARDDWIQVPPVAPPGPVVDTTGAGDSFYAGLIAGLSRGMSVYDAGRLGAAAGACCVTAIGATAGLRSFEETQQLAGVP